MKIVTTLFAAISLLVSFAPRVAARVPDLSAAKALYAAASYEEALAALPKGDGDGSDQPGQVEQYRALCLLALGRTPEARQSLERLVTLQPRYTITDADVSPRLVSMFHEVRKVLLPGITRDTYAKAKVNFENKQYAAASSQLKEMFAMMSDPDMPDQAASMADMKMLGEGFLALSEAQLAAAAKAAPPVPVAIPAAGTSTVAALPPAPVEDTALKIYSVVDKGVTAPVEVMRQMPPWTPANSAEAKSYHTGVITIVINEKGAVEYAALPKSVAPSYNSVLLAAAKSWQFRPARLNGKPVKYSKSYEIVLRAQ